MKETNVDISHALVLTLGTVVMVQCSYLAALLYVIVALLGSLWFMAKICTHCRAFGSTNCSSNYGMISSKLFKRPEKVDFKRAFRRNIASVAIQWFIPLVGGIYCLYLSFDIYLLATLVVFALVAFVWLPVKSRKKGCAKCPQRAECGWASVEKGRNGNDRY